VSDAVTGEDRRVWHLAAATVGPDEAVAAELERAADRARGRGGYAGRASLLRRVVELTPDDTRRATRALSLAEAELAAGNLSAARQVVDQAVPGLDDDRLRGLAMRLNGAILFAAGLHADAADVLASGRWSSARTPRSPARRSSKPTTRLSWAGPCRRDVSSTWPVRSRPPRQSRALPICCSKASPLAPPPDTSTLLPTSATVGVPS
jgi:hypothetical protein